MSLCFAGILPLGNVVGSLSDLLGLRLSLPLQSRPAQISDGPHDITSPLKLSHEDTAIVSERPTIERLYLKLKGSLLWLK